MFTMLMGSQEFLMSERFCGKTKAEIQRQVADINAKNREYWNERSAFSNPFSERIEERNIVSRDLKKQIPSGTSGASNITIPPSNNTRVIVDPMSASARIVEFEYVYEGEEDIYSINVPIKKRKKEEKKKEVKKFIEGKTKRHIDF